MVLGVQLQIVPTSVWRVVRDQESVSLSSPKVSSFREEELPPWGTRCRRRRLQDEAERMKRERAAAL